MKNCAQFLLQTNTKTIPIFLQSPVVTLRKRQDQDPLVAPLPDVFRLKAPFGSNWKSQAPCQSALDEQPENIDERATCSRHLNASESKNVTKDLTNAKVAPGKQMQTASTDRLHQVTTSILPATGKYPLVLRLKAFSKDVYASGIQNGQPFWGLGEVGRRGVGWGN